MLRFLALIMCILLFYIMNTAYDNKFQIGDCVTDSRTELLRKIIGIKAYSYEYCIYDEKKECEDSRFIRIAFFDKIMKKVKCLEDK